MYKIMDGNKAASSIAYLFSEMSFIYPITPSSPMASNVDKLSNQNTKNIFNDIVKVVEMQSEAGVAGALHGSLLAGTLASTYTSSQGLLLMIPNMYKIAGEMLPGVVHVAARTIATHALSIFGDHSDVYATRQTGFCMLSSSNVEDAYNLALVAHLSAIKGSLPFVHFFDGFRTSHEINKIKIIDELEILKLVPYEAINNFRKRMLNVGSGIQKGLAENEDIYFQSVEARNEVYNEMPNIVEEYMNKINKLTGKDYKPFNYYGDPCATKVIVAMGSVSDTIKLVIDKENSRGEKLGLIEVRLYRPFSNDYLLRVLPETVEHIAVLDRTKESGSNGEPLYLDIVNALKDSKIHVVGGRYGLASKNTDPSQIKAVFDMLDSPKNNFTIGIVDDLTNTSLETTNYPIDLDCHEIKICGFGSDGMVSASKDILEILGECSFVQGYFEYDSKKSGGVTISNLRMSEKPIKAPYYVTNPDLVVITKFSYLNRYDMLSNIKEHGTLVLNTDKSIGELDDSLSNNVKKILQDRKVDLYIIDAEKIAEEAGIKGKISKVIETIILKLVGLPNYQEMIEKSIKKIFESKGEDVVVSNLKAVNNALDNFVKVEKNFTLSDIEEEKNNSLFERIINREGDKLTVKDVALLKEGTFPNGMSKEEKRKIATQVPKWISQNCIQCGQCSLVCPHAVIRSFVLKGEKGIPLIGDKEENRYYIGISEADCTNCTLCYQVCPGRNGNKAITFGKFDTEKQRDADELFNNHVNPDLAVLNKYTIKGSQMKKPYFEFSGACAGCGETAYIKLLTQLLGEKLVIANATGCSSIYGGSAPSTPYSVSWANSLFEDNAEFGLGINLAYQKLRNRIENIMNDSIDSVDLETKDLFKEWLSNKEDLDKTMKIKEKLLNKDIPKEISDLIDYIPSRSVWIIGGDGWAYDIGFGGIDHVLSTNENVNILILDTEVYSNTGGQASKSSRVGQVAEFANRGKQTAKKDMFKIAMSYPNCYVASISLGANPMQTIKAFKEAEEHNGPAVIIAYATCVEQGIKEGISLFEQKLAIESGYTLLMRYNPVEEKLYLDSKEPDFSKYEEFLNNEVRYKSLRIKDESKAQELFEQNKQNAMKRYKYYQELANKE